MDRRWQRAVDDYSAWWRASGRSAESLRLRRHYVATLAESHPDPWRVSADDLIRFLARPGWMPETRKSARAAMRSFYSWAVDSSRIGTSPAARLPVVHVPRALPQPAPEKVLAAALEHAESRTRLMLLLAAFGGLRRSEIARVRGADLVGGTLHVVGKGGRERLVPLHPALAAELDGCGDGFLFPGPDGHLSPQHVSKLMKHALGDYHAHQLRHRFATVVYDRTRDLRTCQELLGHARPETTGRYTAVSVGMLRQAVEALPS
jgi:integrase